PPPEYGLCSLVDTEWDNVYNYMRGYWVCTKQVQEVRQVTDYYRLMSWQVGFSNGAQTLSTVSANSKFCVPEANFSNFWKSADFMRPVSLDWNSDGNLDFIALGDSGACEFGNEPSSPGWRLHLSNGNGGFTRNYVT